MMRSRFAALAVAVNVAVSAVVGLSVTACAAMPLRETGADPIGWARKPLDGTTPGDIVRGQRIVSQRQLGLCVLCHRGPFPEPEQHGTLGPDLTGVGGRLEEAAIRARIVDIKRLAPESIMPAYFRSEGFERVGAMHRDKTIFTAQQVEDVVAYLVSLR